MSDNSEVSISSLEMTRNPFDSDIEEKSNYPGFSPSMFVDQRTPVNNRKAKEFHWSIEQISRLYPADVDEFPNQDYSSTCERAEDEKAAQDAIEEYFSQDAIVPSPWSANHSAKKVTFSPHPPDTQYIPNNDCSLDSTYSQHNKVDAGTQTLWSIPVQAVQLDEILGKAFDTSADDSRNLSGSLLRRNLFPIDDQVHGSTDKNNNRPTNTKIRSILKTSKSPVLATSSPLSSNKHCAREQSNIPGTPYCLNVSPIRVSPLARLKQLDPLNSPSNISAMSMSPSKVLESSGLEKDLQMFPDISPIKDDGAIDYDDDSFIPEIADKRMSVIDGKVAFTPDICVSQRSEEIDDDNDSDTETPAKITMEDLTCDYDDDDCDDDDDRDDDDHDDDDEKPPSISLEDLSTTNDADVNNLPRVTLNETKALERKERNDEAMETVSITNAVSSTHEEHMIVSEVNFVDSETRQQHIRQQYHSNLDEHLVMVRAAAALRRANRFNAVEMNPVSPSGYHTPGKWRTPRTFPLSHVERKALYGRLSTYRVPDYVDSYNMYSPQLYADYIRHESK
ncbi:hypothetical protein QZH41_018361, partial [Actinostola sp. cb2023]